MPLPNFTDKEKYLIYALKTMKPTLFSNAAMWMMLVVGGLLSSCAIYFESITMLFSVFVACGVLRVGEESHQLKMFPVWRSIIEKYEQCCLENSSATATPSSSLHHHTE